MRSEILLFEICCSTSDPRFEKFSGAMSSVFSTRSPVLRSNRALSRVPHTWVEQLFQTKKRGVLPDFSHAGSFGRVNDKAGLLKEMRGKFTVQQCGGNSC